MLLHKSRVTVSEHHLVNSLIMAQDGNMSGAKDLVNQQIQGWGVVGISHSDILVKLWLCCQKVTQGKSLLD